MIKSSLKPNIFPFLILIVSDDLEFKFSTLPVVKENNLGRFEDKIGLITTKG